MIKAPALVRFSWQSIRLFNHNELFEVKLLEETVFLSFYSLIFVEGNHRECDKFKKQA